MKHLIFIITMAFMAGLFVAGQALGVSHQEMGTTHMGGSTMGEHSQMHQKAPMATNLNREQVREMQKLLNEQGFDTGQADGIMGAKTQEALRQFQESEGLVATGIPDEETLRILVPSAEKQEFFGLSPEFGEPMEQHPMKQEGSRY